MKTILKIGDYVRHLSTGDLGRVVAYGHEVLDSVYLPTLKVEVFSNIKMNRRMFVEDVSSAWVSLDAEESSRN
jgi:hypothetical protein